MPEHNIVGIHPHKAAVLADATRRAVGQLEDRATDLLRLLGGSGEDLHALVPLGPAIDHLTVEGADLQHVLDEIWTLTASRADPAGRLGLDIWTAPFDPAFVDPSPATRAALEVAAAYRAGDPNAIGAAWSTWSADPVFAMVVLRALGTGALVTQLRTLEGDLTPEPFDHDRRDRQTALVDQLARVYALATQFGVAPFTVDDLASDLVGHQGALGDLGLLVRGDARFSTDVLLDLLRLVVFPINAEILAGRAVNNTSGIHDGDTLLDPRALVFGAIAKDPVAANTSVRRYGLDRLIDERTPYLDGGAALGDLLVAATRPLPGDPEDGRHRQAAFTVIEWIARLQLDHGAEYLQQGMIDRLGRVAAPYVGSFRDPAYDDGRTPTPLGRIGPVTTVAFYDVVGRSASAMNDLSAAALLWAKQVFLAQPPGAIDDRALVEVGHVTGLVSAARARGAIRRAEDADTRAENDRRLWKWIASMATGLITLPGGPIVDAVVPALVDEATGAAIEHGAAPKQLDTELILHSQRFGAEDTAMVLWLWLATLWAGRADSHLFDGLPALPSVLLVPPGDPGGPEPRSTRLKTFAELSEGDLDAFLTWIRTDTVAARTHWLVLSSEAALAPGAGHR